MREREGVRVMVLIDLATGQRVSPQAQALAILAAAVGRAETLLEAQLAVSIYIRRVRSSQAQALTSELNPKNETNDENS